MRRDRIASLPASLSLTADVHCSRLHSLLRLRQELDKLLTFQASKISTPDKQRAFLVTHYEELLQGLSVRCFLPLRAE